MPLFTKYRLTTANDSPNTKLGIVLYIYENKNENENVIHRQIQNSEVNLKIRKIRIMHNQ